MRSFSGGFRISKHCISRQPRVKLFRLADANHSIWASTRFEALHHHRLACGVSVGFLKKENAILQQHKTVTILRTRTILVS
ncbi:hypothetical protein CEXT_761181 [Caerostris extrusa]|uniref:Uncharacterized protein n=1 Tax=Caerostris extrusa TaxID=172846 RepID=A0AAV4Q2X6_CAEEX|nr:hypothetical protein CEXT_761181 [Caerostris extrusa]